MYISEDDVLPNKLDLGRLRAIYVVLISRILVERIPGYAPYKHFVKWHIEHLHSETMANASYLVSAFYSLI